MSETPAGISRVRALAQAGRLADALELLHALAEGGDAEALVTLGNFYWQGRGVAQDPVRGRAYFQRASDAGHPWGRVFATNLLANGLFGPRDWTAALARLKDEAQADPQRARVLSLLEAMDIDGGGDPRAAPEGRRLSDDLQVTLYPGLFSLAECEFLRATAEPLYMRSTINDAQGRQVPHPLRGSDGAPIHWLIEDPAIQALNRRLAAASGTAYDQAEPLLVLRYRPGQQYQRHFDALPGLTNQRVRTALVYLNEDYAGGETEFPRLDLRVKGRTGDVLVFSNTGPDGRADPLSEHAGLPVVSGVKHLASRWIRQSRHLP